MEGERVREGRGKHQEASVFVRNLPVNLDKFGLKGIFQKIGRVWDSFIPRRREWSSQGRFGFVRYNTIEEARSSIQRFNGTRIRGNKIYVSMAQPRRRSKWMKDSVRGRNQRPARVRNDWRKKVNMQEHQLCKFSQEDQPYKIRLEGQINDENAGWLRRSLVCTVTEPRDLATLSSAIMHGFGHSIRVSALSSLKFLLTFPSQEEMEAALSNPEELHQWFVFIKKWDIAESCDNRRVWIDILGVPPQGWKWENFKLIAELWGQLICLGKSTNNTESFEAMRALIATDRFCMIDSEILMLVDNCGYRVTIREIKTVCQAVRKSPHSAHYIKMDGKDSNNHSNSEVPGFEDLKDHVSNQGQSTSEETMKSQARLITISNSNLAEDE